MPYSLTKDNISFKINKSSPHTHTLIFMHGLGDSPESFKNFFDSDFFSDNVNVKVILLRAPINPSTIGGGRFMNSWFDIKRFPILDENCYNYEDVKTMSKSIIEFIKEEAKLLNNDFSKIYLGGFSQGGCLSWEIGYCYEYNLGGILSFSGTLFKQSQILKGKENLKVFCGNGESDAKIPYFIVKETLKPVEKFPGFEIHIYKGLSHTISFDEIKNAKEFLKRIMK